MSDQNLQVMPPAESTGWEIKPAGKSGTEGMLSTAISRQAQEVQAAMFVAKSFPRDQIASYQRILRACERPGLAMEAMYSYPRGGTNVTGPSIRMAEVLAQNWGNLDFGITELEQIPGKESIVMAYCWDLETNTRQTKVFTVPHLREKRGGNEILKDPRDIYELVANQGARRLRACILGIIPGDVVDDAVAKCEETMRKKDQAEGPLAERIKKLALAFQKQAVTSAMLEMRIGKKSDAWTEFDYSTLKKIFLSIRDGFQTKENYFSPESMQGDKPAPQEAAPKFAEPKPRAQRQQKEAPEKEALAPTPEPLKPEPEKPTPAPTAPPVEADPLFPAGPDPKKDAETENNLPVLVHLIKTTSGIESADVLLWLHENRVTTSTLTKLSEIPEAALAILVEKWADVTRDVRGD